MPLQALPFISTGEHHPNDIKRRPEGHVVSQTEKDVVVDVEWCSLGDNVVLEAPARTQLIQQGKELFAKLLPVPHGDPSPDRKEMWSVVHSERNLNAVLRQSNASRWYPDLDTQSNIGLLSNDAGIVAVEPGQ
jgi:hypothetical protein